MENVMMEQEAGIWVNIRGGDCVCAMYVVREFRKLTFLFKAGWLAIAAVISRDVTE